MNRTVFGILVLSAWFTGASSVHAAGSLLRVACEGADAGAEVYVNGKFRGECPVDIQVTEGMLDLRVVKKIDADRERSFHQQARIGDGTIKKVEVTLSGPRLNPEAQRRIDDRLRAEREDAERREAARQNEIAEGVRRDEAGALAGDARVTVALARRYEMGAAFHAI